MRRGPAAGTPARPGRTARRSAPTGRRRRALRSLRRSAPGRSRRAARPWTATPSSLRQSRQPGRLQSCRAGCLRSRAGIAALRGRSQPRCAGSPGCGTCLAAATSSAFTARILLSMSDMVCLLILFAVVPGPVQAPPIFRVALTNCSIFARAAPDAIASIAVLHARLDIAGQPIRIQRGAGIERDDVARRARHVVQRFQHLGPATPRRSTPSGCGWRSSAGRSLPGGFHIRGSGRRSARPPWWRRRATPRPCCRGPRPPWRAARRGAAAPAPVCRPGPSGTRPSGCWARRPGWSAGRGC